MLVVGFDGSPAAENAIGPAAAELSAERRP
jgi:hypothetical protein